MSKETPETKLCKYCKSEIPYDAKVCPHCRKKQTPNGCLIAIIVIVVLFILIGIKIQNGVKINILNILIKLIRVNLKIH